MVALTPEGACVRRFDFAEEGEANMIQKQKGRGVDVQGRRLMATEVPQNRVVWSTPPVLEKTTFTEGRVR